MPIFVQSKQGTGVAYVVFCKIKTIMDKNRNVAQVDSANYLALLCCMTYCHTTVNQTTELYIETHKALWHWRRSQVLIMAYDMNSLLL